MIKAKSGTPVLAPAGGIVLLAALKFHALFMRAARPDSNCCSVPIRRFADKSGSAR